MRSSHNLLFLVTAVIIVYIVYYRTSGDGSTDGNEYQYEMRQVQRVYAAEVESVSCDAFLRNLSITVPALLIDLPLLEQIDSDECLRHRNPIRIGVDVKYLSENHLIEDPRFEVWFYTNDSKTDYLDFRTDPRKIIPKKFPTRWVANVEIPSNIPMFLGFWKRARFIECLNLTMPRNDAKKILEPGPSFDAAARLRDVFLSYGMFPFLNGGTFLGWYRECNMFPHALDIDFSVLIEEFNPEFLKFVKSNKSEFQLTRELGMVKDGLELTFVPWGGYRFYTDVFMMYKEVVNGTINHWVGILGSDGTKWKYSYEEYDPWCAGDLLGHLFWVSCSPREKLTIEYGPLWYLDEPSLNFTSDLSHRNVKQNGKFTEEQMKTIYNVVPVH